VVIDISDTGCGFQKELGSGAGLSNLRERLEARYGAKASVALRANEPSGVTATLAIPMNPDATS
jgi:LytS/YehU family sensor histidine kinase